MANKCAVTVIQFGPVAVAVISGPIAAWIAGKLGRKIRITFGDVEAEARTVEELKQLLKLVDEHREKNNKSGET